MSVYHLVMVTYEFLVYVVFRFPVCTERLQSGLEIFLSFNEKKRNSLMNAKVLLTFLTKMGIKIGKNSARSTHLSRSSIKKNQKRWLFCDFTKYNHTFFEFF